MFFCTFCNFFLCLTDQHELFHFAVKAFDPVAMEEAKRRLGDRIGYAANMYDALTDADAMIIVTEWQEFKVPKFTFIEKALKEKVIFD